MEGGFFFDLAAPLKGAVNGAVDYLVVVHGDAFQAFADSLLVLLVALERALRAAPPAVVVVLVGLLALAAGRSWLLAAGMALVMWLVGALGMWDQAMQTIAIILVSVLITLVLGLPLGILSARNPWVRAAVTPVLDLMQTIPSFVYLIPAAMLFGLGKVPAILATVVYATPPLVRLTDLGIRQVDASTVEAARAFGATHGQILRGVELPLALPSIMQGINQATMMALAMVVIASMIGARGVGETVLLGLQRGDAGEGFVGGLAIVLLAIAFDRITQAYGRRLQMRRAPAG